MENEQIVVFREDERGAAVGWTHKGALVRCGRCEYYSNEMNCCSYVNGLQNVTKTDYCSYGRCADGERRSE